MPRLGGCLIACIAILVPAFGFQGQQSPKSCWIGREVSASFRDYGKSPLNRSLVTVCPSLRIKCHGRVTSWQTTLVVDDGEPINFAVFRNDNDSSGQRFVMVGYNAFLATTKGRVVFEVPKSRQIKVEPGDFLGYFRTNEGKPEFMGFVGVESDAEHFSHKDEAKEPHFVSGDYDSCYQLPMTYRDLLGSGNKITIDVSARYMKRLYSIAAVVQSGRASIRRPRARSNSKRRMQIVHAPRVSKDQSSLGIVSPFLDWDSFQNVAIYHSETNSMLGPNEMTLTDYLKKTDSGSKNKVKNAVSQADITLGRGLDVCGRPPQVEHSYSVNEKSPDFPMAASRAYKCEPNYTPVGFNRIYCDDITGQWTPLSFQCVYTVVVDQSRTVTIPFNSAVTEPTMVTANIEEIPVDARHLTENSDNETPCLFPPIIDNGYAIRQDDITVVYRCYPGFLKVGQVEKDDSVCNVYTNTWSTPHVSCVLSGKLSGNPVIDLVEDVLKIETKTQVLDIARPDPNLLLVPNNAKTMPVPPHPHLNPGQATITIPMQSVTKRPQYQARPRPPPLRRPVSPQGIYLPAPTPVETPSIAPIDTRQPVEGLQPVDTRLPVESRRPVESRLPTEARLPIGPISRVNLDCGSPPRIANGRYYEDPMSHLNTLPKMYLYECYPGYILKGLPSVRCDPETGTFTRMTARCEPLGLTGPTTPKMTVSQSGKIDCGHPPPLTNAFTVTGGKSSTAVYLCLPGFTGVGVAEIQCGVPNNNDPGSGPTWSRTDFRCEPRQTHGSNGPASLGQVVQAETQAAKNSPFLIIPGPTKRQATAPQLSPPFGAIPLIPKPGSDESSGVPLLPKPSRHQHYPETAPQRRIGPAPQYQQVVQRPPQQQYQQVVQRPPQQQYQQVVQRPSQPRIQEVPQPSYRPPPQQPYQQGAQAPYRPSGQSQYQRATQAPYRPPGQRQYQQVDQAPYQPPRSKPSQYDKVVQVPFPTSPTDDQYQREVQGPHQHSLPNVQRVLPQRRIPDQVPVQYRSPPGHYHPPRAPERPVQSQQYAPPLRGPPSQAPTGYVPIYELTQQVKPKPNVEVTPEPEPIIFTQPEVMRTEVPIAVRTLQPTKRPYILPDLSEILQTAPPPLPTLPPPPPPPPPQPPTPPPQYLPPEDSQYPPKVEDPEEAEGSVVDITEGSCAIFQTCGEPPKVLHAMQDPSFTNRHSCPGDYVRYICHPGYKLDTSISAVFCSQATYSWSPLKTPSCISVNSQ